MFTYSIDGKEFFEKTFPTKFKAIVQAILDHDLAVDDAVYVKELDQEMQKFLITPKQITLTYKKKAKQ